MSYETRCARGNPWGSPAVCDCRVCCHHDFGSRFDERIGEGVRMASTGRTARRATRSRSAVTRGMQTSKAADVSLDHCCRCARSLCRRAGPGEWRRGSPRPPRGRLRPAWREGTPPCGDRCRCWVDRVGAVAGPSTVRWCLTTPRRDCGGVREESFDSMVGMNRRSGRCRHWGGGRGRGPSLLAGCAASPDRTRGE